MFVGDRVGLNGRDDRHGTVMFVGPTEFAKKGEVIVGIALDNKRSNSSNDGKVEETRYFRCKPGHALFVDIEDVQVLDTASEAGIGEGGAQPLSFFASAAAGGLGPSSSAPPFPCDDGGRPNIMTPPLLHWMPGILKSPFPPAVNHLTLMMCGPDSGPLFLETELLKLVGCGAAKELLRDVRDALEV